MKKKLVEVYKAHGEGEAELVRSKLESFGIPSVLKSNAAPSVVVFTVNGLGEYKVMVWEDLADEAREILKVEENIPE
jgi:hypothetical protein